MKKIIPCLFLKMIVFLVILTVFAAGCDRHTKYKALTFFFTGVPALEDNDVLAEKKELNTAAERKRKNLPQEISSYVHGPYGAGQCEQCHDTFGSVSLIRSSKETKKPVQGLQQGVVPGRLVLPLKELCIDCHASKSVLSAYNLGLWIHGPVSDGLCTKCHSPHQSPYQYMLTTGNSVEMCSQCHSEGYILKTGEHTKNKPCTECHNAHIGKDRFLLKKDFNEGF